MYIIKKINSLDTNLAISYLSDLFLAHFFLQHYWLHFFIFNILLPFFWYFGDNIFLFAIRVSLLTLIIVKTSQKLILAGLIFFRFFILLLILIMFILVIIRVQTGTLRNDVHKFLHLSSLDPFSELLYSGSSVLFSGHCVRFCNLPEIAITFIFVLHAIELLLKFWRQLRAYCKAK